MPIAPSSGTSAKLKMAVDDPHPAVAARRLYTLIFVCLAAVYFQPARKHVCAERKPDSAKLRGPAIASYLELLGKPKLLKFAIKRDGGLDIQLSLAMRMSNKLAAPLVVRGMNMTAAFRAAGGEKMYEAGYQEIGAFTAPPFGAVNITAKYVLNDLRPSMLLAIALDAVAELRRKKDKPELPCYSYGVLKLWSRRRHLNFLSALTGAAQPSHARIRPVGSLDLDCVMMSPLGGG
ncbi:hypothetical protein M885DRAFT_507553 [Pelagophyceae sp. CCMP2097]|nr:hypothetical protein M885DRAFT_507553 [Pelagophyceae sp. CCMP2097]